MASKRVRSDSTPDANTEAKRPREDNLKWGSTKNPSELTWELIAQMSDKVNRTVLFGKQKGEVCPPLVHELLVLIWTLEEQWGQEGRCIPAYCTCFIPRCHPGE